MDAGGEDFETWYRREHRQVLSSMVLVFGDVERARDSTDEAFARAFGQWSRVREMRSPGGWVLRVAINAGKRAARRAALEERLLRRTPRPGEVPGPVLDVWDAVARLPRRQRTAVVLRYVADLPEAEIAVAMGIRRGTVASTLHDARRALEAGLTDKEGRVPNVEVRDAGG